MKYDESTLPLLLATDIQHHFKRVVETFQHRLYAFVYRLTLSRQDAEDIVQESFVRAYVALITYPQTRIQALKLQPWLYKIALHEFHHQARNARLHMIPIEISDDNPIFEIEDTENTRPEILIENQEEFQELETAVSHLPERYRIPIMCYYFEHLSYQEIADLLDQPLGTIKSTALWAGTLEYHSVLAHSTVCYCITHAGTRTASWIMALVPCDVYA